MQKKKLSEEDVTILESGGKLVQDESYVETTEETAIQLPNPNAISPMSETQLQRLWDKTPKRAIKHKPGPNGTLLPYVPHGYVEFKLNQVFGGDWDYELMPMFDGGNAFYFHTAEIKVPNKPVMYKYSVTVVGRLTVRVRNPENPSEILTTIVKTEPGSAEFFPQNEFGDSVKSASSDAFKRCAFRLGIAADMYYDDEKAQEAFEQSERIRLATEEKIKREQEARIPSNATEVVMKVKRDYNIDAADLFKRLYGLPFAEGVPHLASEFLQHSPDEVWSGIRAVLFPDNNSTGEG